MYNKRDTILRAINSVLNQSRTEFELIVIDDGSTDDSLSIVSLINDSRVILAFQKNGGVSSARNLGISMARGEFIAFLDADDAWDQDFLEMLEDMIFRFPAAGAYAAHAREPEIQNHTVYPNITCEVFKKADYIILQSYFSMLRDGYYPITSSSICIRRIVFQKIGGFDTSLCIGEDLDMWIRVYLGFGVALSRRFGATYHTDASNRSVNRRDFSLRELDFFIHLRRRYLNINQDKQSYDALNEWTSNRIYAIAIRSIYHENKRLAVRIMLENWREMRFRQLLLGAARICAPNPMVKYLKQIKRYGV